MRRLRDRGGGPAKHGSPAIPWDRAGGPGAAQSGDDGRGRMIQLAPQMRILVAIEAQDFRTGIDGLARVCGDVLEADPFGGTLFVFRNRRGTALKCLVYDSQGFWLAQKRLSRGRFRWWPTSRAAATLLEAHQLQRLLMGGDPAARDAAPVWRRIRTG